MNMSYLIPESIIKGPTPSFNDGISHDVEFVQRVHGCEIIQQAGILLRLPQVVMVTGQIFLNRFYFRKSLTRFDVFTVAMGCVLLASKVEEKFKSLREVIYIFHRVFLRRRELTVVTLELGGGLYTQWKNELVTMEMYLLKELGFSLYTVMDQPHKYLLYFIKILNGSNALAQVAWSYLNDSMRLCLSLEHHTEIVACAAVYLASRKLSFPLPESWWMILGTDLSTIRVVSDKILRLYYLPKIKWVESLAPADYLAATYEATIICPSSTLATIASGDAVRTQGLESFDGAAGLQLPHGDDQNKEFYGRQDRERESNDRDTERRSDRRSRDRERQRNDRDTERRSDRRSRDRERQSDDRDRERRSDRRSRDRERQSNDRDRERRSDRRSRDRERQSDDRDRERRSDRRSPDRERQSNDRDTERRSDGRSRDRERRSDGRSPDRERQSNDRDTERRSDGRSPDRERRSDGRSRDREQ